MRGPPYRACVHSCTRIQADGIGELVAMPVTTSAFLIISLWLTSNEPHTIQLFLLKFYHLCVAFSVVTHF